MIVVLVMNVSVSARKIYVVTYFPSEFNTHENVLCDILKVDNCVNYIRKKRLVTLSHISRLANDNPARIIILGEPVNGKKGAKQNKKKYNWYDQVMKDAKIILQDDQIINLLNKNIRKFIKNKVFS